MEALNGLLELIGILTSDFIAREYEEEPVKILVTAQDLNVFIDDGFIELTKGSEQVVPRWIARKLAAKNQAKIVNDDISRDMLSQLVFNEDRYRNQLRFEKLKGYFYHRMKDTLVKNVEEYGRSPDIKRLQEVSELVRIINDSMLSLTRLRTRKIVSLTMTPGYPADIVENLSEEEKILFNALKTILDIYYRRFIGVETIG
ncbi:DNA replication complex GINS family protein [Desulfurococcus amylolyticus]|uniref:DNA replication complex GINS family protein n=1 Tax=Desulfurococcus amylolyticus TaxID=94694 RepID=UPI001F2C8F16|nr:DNA replication complex GINS family protein [Desulfurococcus amylolyticus]